VAIENGRSLAAVVSELKDELKDFISTRIEMLKSEMKDNISAIKVAIPIIAGALVLGGTAWFVLTAALISIIATGFYPSHYSYFFAFVIVGVAYALLAVIMGSFAYRELKKRGFMPERTIRVLKQDQVWLQKEARQQL